MFGYRFRAALAAGFALIIASGCTQKETQKTAQKPVPVHVMAAVPEDVPRWMEVMGKTEGSAQAEIRAQVSGILKTVAYREGEAVRRGQLLFAIDPAPYEAALKEAKATEKQTLERFTQTRRETERTARLAAEQAVPQKELDDANSDLAAAAAALDAARAKTESASVSLSHTRVTAPSDGIAGLSLLNPGALVTAQSTLLTTLSQKNTLRAVFAVSDRDLAEAVITPDNSVEVVNSAGKRLPASLDYVSQTVSDGLGTRQMRARVLIAENLMAGEFVRVRLQTGIEKGVVKVPQSAVIQESDGTYSVFIKKEGKARKVPVTVGPWNETDWIIRSGLSAGDLVITDQILRLREGRDVTEPAAASEAVSASAAS